MNNISIKGMCAREDIDRKINLHNGDIVLHKGGKGVRGIYLVTSFRDNKNRYNGAKTTEYCSLINLDTGKIAFEERCTRATTERRVMSHLNHGGIAPYTPAEGERVSVYTNGNWKMELELGKEQVIGGERWEPQDQE